MGKGKVPVVVPAIFRVLYALYVRAFELGSFFLQRVFCVGVLDGMEACTLCSTGYSQKFLRKKYIIATIQRKVRHVPYLIDATSALA